MSYEVIATPRFRRDIKILIKKYISLKKEFEQLISDLEEEPQLQGTPLGNNCYKVRIAIASKGKGKSGGARVITNLIVTDKTVILIAIYDKSEKESITDRELEQLLDQIPI